MKAIILCAGQGRRLLPLTAQLPKCLMPVAGERSVLALQLAALERCGVTRATVMAGFGADRVERAIAREIRPGLEISLRFNPLYASTDNLITSWLAQSEMDGDFLLLNGDTLFEAELLERVLADAREPIAIALSRKSHYDDDDMKVVLGAGACVRSIGKKLNGRSPDGEAIGLSVFRGDGVFAFREALDRAVREPDALHDWYTAVLDDLAGRLPVRTVQIDGLWWTEIDDRTDLEEARTALRERPDLDATTLPVSQRTEATGSVAHRTRPRTAPNAPGVPPPRGAR